VDGRVYRAAIRGSAARLALRGSYSDAEIQYHNRRDHIAAFAGCAGSCSSAQRDPELERQARNLTGAVFAIDHYRGLNWIHHSGEMGGVSSGTQPLSRSALSTLVTCNCVGSMKSHGDGQAGRRPLLGGGIYASREDDFCATASSLPATTLKRTWGRTGARTMEPSESFKSATISWSW